MIDHTTVVLKQLQTTNCHIVKHMQKSVFFSFVLKTVKELHSFVRYDYLRYCLNNVSTSEKLGQQCLRLSTAGHGNFTMCPKCSPLYHIRLPITWPKTPAGSAQQNPVCFSAFILSLCLHC